jgi:hypothetical protein
MQVEKYISLNPGNNLITEDLTILGIQIKDRHKSPSSIQDCINLSQDSEKIVDSLPVYFLQGNLPFPCRIPVRANSNLLYEIETSGNYNKSLILLCQKGIHIQNDGLIKAFRVLPESGNEEDKPGYASIKPFHEEKWKILFWAYVLENYNNDDQFTEPSGASDAYIFGKMDISIDDNIITQAVSLESIFSKRDYYKLQNVEFEQLLYIKTEPTYYDAGGASSFAFPHIAISVERIKLSETK